MAEPPSEIPPEAPPEPVQHVSAEDARGGEIILRRKWERVVFLVGLVAAILLGLAIYALVWR